MEALIVSIRILLRWPALGLSCMILWAMVDRFHSRTIITRNLDRGSFSSTIWSSQLRSLSFIGFSTTFSTIPSTRTIASGQDQHPALLQHDHAKQRRLRRHRSGESLCAIHRSAGKHDGNLLSSCCGSADGFFVSAKARCISPGLADPTGCSCVAERIAAARSRLLALKVEFSADVGAVVFDGAVVDRQLGANLLAYVLPSAISRMMRRSVGVRFAVMRRPAAIGGFREMQQLLGNSRADVGAPGRNRAHPSDDFLGGTVLRGCSLCFPAPSRCGRGSSSAWKVRKMIFVSSFCRSHFARQRRGRRASAYRYRARRSAGEAFGSGSSAA